jgi:glycerophosphoryl diester phosphodiesterase
MIKIISLILFFMVIFLFSTASAKAKTLCIAHRGGSAYCPENTMSAFENAVLMGADYVELDVHLSKDGYIVVIHDDTVNRTTDGTGQVKDKTLEELKKVDAGSWFSDKFKGERLPTLEEVMDFAKGKIGLVIEIKNTSGDCEGIDEKVVKLLQEKDMVKDVIVISFDKKLIKNVHKLDENIPTGILFGGKVENPCEMADELGATYLSPYWGIVTEDMVKDVHSNNLKLNLWTVNETDIMKKLIDLGVDAITTDKPDLLLKQLGR